MASATAGTALGTPNTLVDVQSSADTRRIAIDKVGIKPDMEVELKEEDAKKDIDTQLEAAIKYLDALVK